MVKRRLSWWEHLLC